MVCKTSYREKLNSELNRGLRSSIQSDAENVKFRQHIKAIMPMCSSLFDVWNFIEIRRSLGLLENKAVQRTADNIQFLICKIDDERDQKTKVQKKHQPPQSKFSNFYRLIERDELRRNFKPELEYLFRRSAVMAHRDG